jgi:hypothetical protein
MALSIVAGTAAVFVWRRVHSRRFNFQRDTHCGCSSSSDARPPSVTYRQRKGEQPQVIVKMK